MKRVRIIANDFAKRMCIEVIPLKYETLCSIAERNNWKILTYSEGIGIIKSFGLEEHCIKNNGFTLHNNKITIIFINDDLDYLAKINVICHEMGHLVLDHTTFISKEIGITGNSKIHESEAEVFALELQAPIYLIELLRINNAEDLVNMGIFSKTEANKYYRIHRKERYKSTFHFLSNIVILTAILFIVAIITIFYNKMSRVRVPHISEAVLENTSETEEVVTEFVNNSLVYVTSEGEKYHTADCRYIKGKKIFSYTLTEAEEKRYVPCLVCKPNKGKATDNANIRSHS